MTRLAATLQMLHDGAHDQSLSEEDGKQAAMQLAVVMLKHFDLIVAGLRLAGK